MEVKLDKIELVVPATSLDEAVRQASLVCEQQVSYALRGAGRDQLWAYDTWRARVGPMTTLGRVEIVIARHVPPPDEPT